ncbi:MAG TPA: hypothetical protein VGS23_00940, partial [Thermoplasmata archaeon]|nr:hypothetical protein [Thermoplasmata archaeon]
MVDPISIEEFWTANREAFESMGGSLKASLKDAAGRAPLSMHQAIQMNLLEKLLDFSSGSSTRACLRVVVDANIIVADSFAVGKGRPSNTPRVFASPFLQVFGPPQLREEVLRSIEEDLPKGT